MALPFFNDAMPVMYDSLSRTTRGNHKISVLMLILLTKIADHDEGKKNQEAPLIVRLCKGSVSQIPGWERNENGSFYYAARSARLRDYSSLISA